MGTHYVRVFSVFMKLEYLRGLNVQMGLAAVSIASFYHLQKLKS